MSKILVTGATGHLGATVVENLLTKINASEISVLVRDAAKGEDFKAKGINVVVGDYHNYDSLVAAFSGIDKLYLVSSSEIENRDQQHINAVKAAKAAGVKHIVYTSFQRKNETASSPIAFIAEGHLAAEKAIKESGLTYTILQHGLYADIIPLFAGDQVLTNHTIYLPAGDGKTAFALRSDFAVAGANVLLDETGKYENQAIELAGSEAISWTEIAEIIAAASGQPVVYVSPTVAEFSETLTKAGVPAMYIGMFAGFSEAIAQSEFTNIDNALEELLGRKPASVKAYLKSVYQK